MPLTRWNHKWLTKTLAKNANTFWQNKQKEIYFIAMTIKLTFVGGWGFKLDIFMRHFDTKLIFMQQANRTKN